MSLLYEVYTHHSKGAWGVAINDQTVHTVTVNDQSFSDSTLPAHQLAGELSKRMRMGYTKTNKAKYLKVIEGPGGKLQGTFVDQHPELTVSGGLVIFTTLSKGDDLEALTQQWESLLDKTDVRPEEVASWIREVKSASQYIVAPAMHPAIALVLADWAIENKRLLVAGADGIPTQSPKNAPSGWESWLANFFDSKGDVRTALEQLGWSLRDVLTRNDVQSTTNDGDVDSWFTGASSIAF
jgi:hypothetical protein